MPPAFDLVQLSQPCLRTCESRMIVALDEGARWPHLRDGLRITPHSARCTHARGLRGHHRNARCWQMRAPFPLCRQDCFWKIPHAMGATQTRCLPGTDGEIGGGCCDEPFQPTRTTKATGAHTRSWLATRRSIWRAALATTRNRESTSVGKLPLVPRASQDRFASGCNRS